MNGFRCGILAQSLVLGWYLVPGLTSLHQWEKAFWELGGPGAEVREARQDSSRGERNSVPVAVVATGTGN